MKMDVMTVKMLTKLLPRDIPRSSTASSREQKQGRGYGSGRGQGWGWDRRTASNIRQADGEESDYSHQCD